MGAPFLSLVRVAVTAEYGAFGVLCNYGVPFAVTLERTYEEPGEPVVKIPPGTWLCTQTIFHHGQPKPYATFEVHIFGHSRLLFHKGNIERHSDGCILVAESFALLPPNATPGVSQSAAGFIEFMERCGDRQSFELVVV